MQSVDVQLYNCKMFLKRKLYQENAEQTFHFNILDLK